ncbi:type I 3-dehydroquinate dehydratase [Candidatus Micrarchaeota archaeon]|nr:type I 3-dehydroquinate dehydratase [Candidatus Micrarchaeota archaeon]
MNAKICVPIIGKTCAESAQMLAKARELGADLAELRMDYLKPGELAGVIELIKASKLPVIATARPVWEGGLFKGSEVERGKLLSESAKFAEYVDIELDAGIIESVKNAVRNSKAKLIVSKHDFKCTMPQKKLEEVVEKERRAGANLCKVVCTATKFEDNNALLQVVSSASKNGAIVGFCMGDLGISSRVLSPLFGASFAFACLEYGKESAAGQVSVAELKKFYEQAATRFTK